MGNLRRSFCCALSVFILIFSSGVMAQNCADPEGVANAEILTSSPYASGDLVTYRCYSGFTMSGSPSQLCSTGSWSGTAPSCSYISRADVNEQNVEFTNQSGDSMMYGMIILIGALFLIMAILLIIVLCIICRRFRSRTARKPKKVKIKSPSPSSVRTPRMVDLVDRVVSENRQQAKELPGWRPFKNPVRNINTSTQ